MEAWVATLCVAFSEPFLPRSCAAAFFATSPPRALALPGRSHVAPSHSPPASPTLRPKKCRLCYVAGSGFHSRSRLAVAGAPRKAATLMHSETTHSRVRGQASWLDGPNLLNAFGAKLLVKPQGLRDTWCPSCLRRSSQFCAPLCDASTPPTPSSLQTARNPVRTRLRSGLAAECLQLVRRLVALRAHKARKLREPLRKQC